MHTDGISAATTKAYRSGLHRYITFCSEINQLPIPISEDTLLLFIAHLAQQNLSYTTIQVYLSAVQYSESITFDAIITPRLRYVLKGIRKTCTLTHQPKERLPITFSIMKRLYMVFLKYPTSYKDIMIWVACCLAYFRVDEFTTPSPDSFDQSTDLLLSDIALDCCTSPTLVKITLKQCKNDQFRM